MEYPYKQKIKNRIRVPNDFESINETNMFKFLDRVEPFGMTSMRDAVFLALEKVKSVSERHYLMNKDMSEQQSGYINSNDSKYSFKIIVVTDGADTSSTLTASDISKHLCNTTQNTSVDDLNLLFVTIDLDKHDQANLDIIGISHNSETHCKKIEAKSEELVEIFEKEVFKNEEKIETQVVKQVYGKDVLFKKIQIKSIEIEVEKMFAVTFVIDISGSMEGQRWNSLKAAIKNLKEKLSMNPSNMVDLILFNDSVFHYTHPHFNKMFTFEFFTTFCSIRPFLCFLFCFWCAPCCMSELALSKAEGRDFRLSGIWINFLCAPLCLALNRRKIKKTYNIPGYCIIDYFLEPCFCFCMTSQEWAEARYRGQGLILI